MVESVQMIEIPTLPKTEKIDDTAADSSRSIHKRLNPQELGEAQMRDLFRLSLDTSDMGIENYGKQFARLTDEQQREFTAYKIDSLENAKVSNMTPDQRSRYFSDEQEQVIEEARQDAIDAVTDADEKRLLLYSLKLREPTLFKEKYNQLPVAEQVAFDAFEAKEDAAVKIAAPDLVVPRLSVDGENWVTPPAGNLPPMDEAQLSKEDLEALNKKAHSIEPAERKEYAKAVQAMPMGETIALANYRREAGKPLNENYLNTMYRNGHSGDARLIEDFKREALSWTPNEQKQYMQYAQHMQASGPVAQKPKGVVGRIRGWLSRKRK